MTYKEDIWVDVHDEALMVSLGIHPKQAEPRDESVWTKTPKEKRLLASMRRKSKKFYGGLTPVKPIPVECKLIIYLKKNKRFPKTTYSVICRQHKIGEHLGRYIIMDKNGNINSLVDHYYYNGKTYRPNERPYWGV